MSDKLDAGPYWGNSNLPPKWNEPAVPIIDPQDLMRERDELRATVTRLRAAITELQEDVERLQQQRAEQVLKHERLRAAAIKLDGYWVSDTYDPSTKNVSVRESAFAELRDLLGLKPKTYP